MAERARELDRYYRKYYPEEHHDLAAGVKLAIQGEMIEFFEQAASANRATNVERTAWLFYATISVITALVLLLVSRVIFYAIDAPQGADKGARIPPIPRRLSASARGCDLLDSNT